MSYWRRHRWTRRLVLGLAFASFVGPAHARPIESAAGEVSSPNVISYLSHGMTAADALDPQTGIPLSAGIPAPGDPYIVADPGYGALSDAGPVRPDARADRFVVGDATPAAPVAGSDRITIEWQDGLTVGLGALALALALGLAVTYVRRPRIAGL